MKLRSRAARRYARALHDLATEASALDAVSADLKSLRRSLESSPELRAFVANVLLPADARVRVLTALFSNRTHPLVWRFIRFLESKRRAGLLEEISADFQEQEEARQGILRGSLASAYPVSPSDASELAGRLGSRWGRKVFLETEENPDLLGGGRLQVGDTVYDFSLSARLRMMRQTMMAG
ncbi:MAG: ATP synthase F1 subunit delta [bacterium]